jgi:hypothetical protein
MMRHVIRQGALICYCCYFWRCFFRRYFCFSPRCHAAMLITLMPFFAAMILLTLFTLFRLLPATRCHPSFDMLAFLHFIASSAARHFVSFAAHAHNEPTIDFDAIIN